LSFSPFLIFSSLFSRYKAFAYSACLIEIETSNEAIGKLISFSSCIKIGFCENYQQYKFFLTHLVKEFGLMPK